MQAKDYLGYGAKGDNLVLRCRRNRKLEKTV